MKRTLYKKEQLEPEAPGKAMTLKYFLLEAELEIDSCILKCYGVEIKKTALDGEYELAEVKQIPNAFFNKSEAIVFLERLAKNTVTPMALSGVLTDYITEEVQERKRLPILI